MIRKVCSCFKASLLAFFFLSASTAYPVGGSHTSSGGNLTVLPVEDSDISSFLNSPDEWKKLLWIQRIIIEDLIYLTKTGLIEKENNFFLQEMGPEREEIILQLKNLTSKDYLPYIRQLTPHGKPLKMTGIMLNRPEKKCFSENQKVSASVSFDDDTKMYNLCIDYDDIKKSSDKDTFQLFLTSILTHEIVHTWNNGRLNYLKKDYRTKSEVLPRYFQRLTLKYFSYANHARAQNSIHKIYVWVSELHRVLSIFNRIPEEAYQKNDIEISKVDRDKEDISMICDSYFIDNEFPSEEIVYLNTIYHLFLTQGLLEVPMEYFSRLSQILNDLVMLKYYCFENQNQNFTAKTPLYTFFNSLDKRNIPFSNMDYYELNDVLASEFPGEKFLPYIYAERPITINPKDPESFFKVLQIVLMKVQHIYFSQKIVPTLENDI
ncbi:MAG: hypothetical protein ACXVCY_08975 [Pseudobdellovibrionaceae bacterium]